MLWFTSRQAVDNLDAVICVVMEALKSPSLFMKGAGVTYRQMAAIYKQGCGVSYETLMKSYSLIGHFPLEGGVSTFVTDHYGDINRAHSIPKI